MNIGRPLIYEIARYEPQILLALECVDKSIQTKICSDLDYMYTLVEEIYQLSDIRAYSWEECKQCLSKNLTLVICSRKTINLVYVATQKIASYKIKELPATFGGAGLVLLSN